MRIVSVEALPIRVPRSIDEATGTAGSPTSLQDSEGAYRWSQSYPTLYAVDFETALVKVTTDSGLLAWGEAQAPLAPQVACTIVDCLLKPVLVGAEFGGDRSEIETLWQRMYSTMRVRGQTGGFMLDAIAGVDLALWDLAGKTKDRSVSELIAPGAACAEVPAYVSGLSGSSAAQRVAWAEEHWRQDFRTFKLFHDASPEDLLDLFDSLRRQLGVGVDIAVDGLWRFEEEEAVAFGKALDGRKARWLECPLAPEDPAAHARLARQIQTPLALGESYRTRYELAPFFRERALGVLQPDLGRSGLTESLRLSAMAAAAGIGVVPHISIAAGPQVAAALHFAAATPHCRVAEYNPKVLDIANRFLVTPLKLANGHYQLPDGPGLGVEIREDAVRAAALKPKPA